jgi:hypothetical protein
MKDEVLEEVYAARKKIAEECDYDFKKLVERYKRSIPSCWSTAFRSLTRSHCRGDASGGTSFVLAPVGKPVRAPVEPGDHAGRPLLESTILRNRPV